MPNHGGNQGGRAFIEMDTVELEKLCALQCTQPEIASWFGVTTQTIENRVKSDRTYEHPVGDRQQTLELTFKEIMQRGYDIGRISLRRKQVQIAEGGNAAMCIFLGKNLLGQRDNLDSVVATTVSGSVNLNVSNPGQILRSRIASLAERIGQGSGTQRAN